MLIFANTKYQKLCIFNQFIRIFVCFKIIGQKNHCDLIVTSIRDSQVVKQGKKMYKKELNQT